jgi:hypothetical protein
MNVVQPDDYALGRKVQCIIISIVTYRSIARQRLDKHVPAERDYW